jgi:zinc transport system permease protein
LPASRIQRASPRLPDRPQGTSVLEPFLVRAIIAGLALAIVAAPLGCFVIWQRMAYFGETVAQASLIGVALSLAFRLDITLGVVVIAVLVAFLLLWFGRQQVVALDSILGLLHHAALATGVIAMSMLKGPPVDLLGFLFGDVFAVTRADIAWIAGGGAAVLAIVAWLWQPLLRLALHEDLAAAEGIDRRQVRAIFTILLAVTIAVAMKIVGVLLVMAFLVVPAVAARPISGTPERMVLLTALVAAASVVAGLGLSATFDTPGGPSIVIVMSIAAAASLTAAGVMRGR